MPSVELMTTETFNLGEAAVGVADIFEGTNPPVEFLKKRAGDMLRANPWLAGRLKTVPTKSQFFPGLSE